MLEKKKGDAEAERKAPKLKRKRGAEAKKTLKNKRGDAKAGRG